MQRAKHHPAVSAIKFLLPLAIIAVLVWHIEPPQWRALRDQPKHFGLLAAALFLMLAAMCLSFVRWCILVRCQGIELTMREAFRLGSICFLLSFVSVGSVGGDLFKAVFLARRRPKKRIEAVASVVVDRISGLYGLLFLVVLVGFALQSTDAIEFANDLGKLRNAAFLMLSVASAFLLFFIIGGRWVDRFLIIVQGIPSIGPRLAKLGTPLRAFHAHPWAFAGSLLMSVGVQALFAVAVYFIARGMYEETPGLAEHLIIVPLGKLASALPLTPAGIGVWEAAIDALYKMVPTKPTGASGTLVALLFNVFNIALALAAAVFYWTANEEVRESLENTDSPEILDQIEGPNDALRPSQT